MGGSGSSDVDGFTFPDAISFLNCSCCCLTKSAGDNLTGEGETACIASPAVLPDLISCIICCSFSASITLVGTAGASLRSAVTFIGVSKSGVSLRSAVTSTGVSKSGISLRSAVTSTGVNAGLRLSVV